VLKVRKLAICFLLALFAFAAATVITTSNVHGEGRAVNGEGRLAQVFMDVTKVAHNDHSASRGSFRFTSPGENHTSAGINMPMVGEAGFAENVATFAGPAVLRMADGSVVHEYHGRVAVIATSNRHRDEIGDPDMITINFVPAVQSDPSFRFEGNLTAGDIAVTTTKSY
jgi:hypothetical protein